MTRRKLTKEEKKIQTEHKRELDRIRQRNLRTNPSCLAKEQERDWKRKRKVNLFSNSIDLIENGHFNDIGFNVMSPSQDIERNVSKFDGISFIVSTSLIIIDTMKNEIEPRDQSEKDELFAQDFEEDIFEENGIFDDRKVIYRSRLTFCQTLLKKTL